MPSGLEALAALQLLPLPAQVRQRPLQGWSFWLQGQNLFSQPEPPDPAQTCTLVDPDSLLDALIDHLRAEPGADLRLGTAVVDLMERDGRITGLVLESGERLQGELVVGCDGRSSLLRRRGGLTAGPRQRPIDLLWFHLPSPASDALAAQLGGRFHTLIGDGGSLALYASPAGGVQLGWPLQAGQRPPGSGRQWRELWSRLAPPDLARALQELPEAAIGTPQRLPVQVDLAERWWRPGLLLIGDAAHPMSPLRAQGTAMGLRDAVTAASLLIPALGLAAGISRQRELDRVLAAVETRRRPEIARIQELQQREWSRGERLLHSPALRRLLAALAPALAPLLAGIWWRSQQDLRQGLAASGPEAWAPPAMMG